MNIIDNFKPTTYINATSTKNYETINVEEFGDNIGYNETLERQSVISSHIKYYHFPLVFPNKLNFPGLHSPRKVWWAKEISPDFHICGRMSERQIKYAAEAGFKSIISLFTYPTEDLETSFGGAHLPNTEEERNIAELAAGLQFFAVLDPLDEWASTEAVRKFTSVADHLKKPALLHCDRGYTITFVVLLYLANQTKNNASFETKIHARDFFHITASMGFDFFYRIPLEVVSEITGEPLVHTNDPELPRPDFHPKEWLDYWLGQPVYYNWFIAGQIYKSHIKLFEEFEYKSIINLRAGLTHRGKASQEEVNLLNIDSSTSTYGDFNTPPRQSDECLKKTRLNPNLPNSYISNTSDVNYERKNEEEFGDDIGYNAEFEKTAFENLHVKYYHLPFYFDEELSEFEEFFKKNKETLLKIGEDGPVLVHCAMGLRAATVTVLTAALQYGLTLDWALQRLKELGFGISMDTYPYVYKVYEKYLTFHEKIDL
ncbi:hypothetical protein Btru_052197 [Bulinus truncatus]|nr:hypothetical protein Btru_052197 [Bulinus truncatus]